MLTCLTHGDSIEERGGWRIECRGKSQLGKICRIFFVGAKDVLVVFQGVLGCYRVFWGCSQGVGGVPGFSGGVPGVLGGCSRVFWGCPWGVGGCSGLIQSNAWQKDREAAV